MRKSLSTKRIFYLVCEMTLSAFLHRLVRLFATHFVLSVHTSLRQQIRCLLNGVELTVPIG